MRLSKTNYHQRGELIMSQGVLPIKYEAEKSKSGLTAFAGLPLYLDMASKMDLRQSINKHLSVREESQGWTDSQVVNSLIMLNLAGGDCVEDLKILEGDEGLCRILRHVEHHGLPRKERRQLERRWRKEKKRTVPSPSAIFRYLSVFHDSDQEEKRVEGKAFIPAPTHHLQGFNRINKDMLAFIQQNKEEKIATLDMDATLVETGKSDALYSYKSYKAYQPLNTWWAEQGVIAHTEFRDGNVPAGYEQLRVLKEALLNLPESVESVRLRSDTAGYQHDLLKYCSLDNKRFGKIEFAIGCSVTKEFKQAVSDVSESDWHPLLRKDGSHSGTEWAEVCFVPNAIGHSKNGPEYRYLAKRTLLKEQQSLPGFEEPQNLPFPTMDMAKKGYKVFGVVTNMDWDGNELIDWHHKRCGKSEEAHSIMKSDLAGGKFPSSDFGENAAWWWIMILSLNLNETIKSMAMEKSWASKRIKAIRFSLINIAGRVMERSRQLVVRVSKNHPSFELILKARSKIAQLSPLLC